MKINKTIAVTVITLLLFAGYTTAVNINPNVDIDVNDDAWAAKDVQDVDKWAADTLKESVEGDYKVQLENELLDRCYAITELEIKDIEDAIAALDAEPKAGI